METGRGHLCTPQGRTRPGSPPKPHLPKVLLSLQELLLASGRVGEQLVPALHQGGVASLDGLGLHVLGRQQLVLQRRDVGDALLLEGLETSVKGLLQREREQEHEGKEGEGEERRGGEGREGRNVRKKRRMRREEELERRRKERKGGGGEREDRRGPRTGGREGEEAEGRRRGGCCSLPAW